MSEDFLRDGAELERELHEARELLASLRAGRVQPVPQGESVHGEGQAADGRIKAVMAADGSLVTLELDPRVLRLPKETLGDETAVAVNAALADLRAQSPGIDLLAVPDLTALSEQFQEIRQEALRQMDAITEGITDAMAQIRERTFISGDPSPTGFAQVMDMAQRNLDAARSNRESSEEVRGEGSAADGQVVARVAAGGRVEPIEIGQRALRLGSQELAGEIRTAVNAALRDLLEKARDQMTPGGVSREEFSERIREVQDASLSQMRTYTQSLQDIMLSIGEPGDTRGGQ